MGIIPIGGVLGLVVYSRLAKLSVRWSIAGVTTKLPSGTAPTPKNVCAIMNNES
jgi:hypothetical protein